MVSKSAIRIDFHTHILHPDLMVQAEDKVVITGFGMRPAQPRLPGSRRDVNYGVMLDPARHVAAMDRRGVDKHVISSSTVIQGTYWSSADEEPALCRIMNDTMGLWVAAYPDRFEGSLVLPLQNLNASLGELERCCDRYGFKVINAPASVNGRYLGEPHFDALWRLVEQHELIVFIHPDGVRDPWFQRYSLWNSIGQPFEEMKLISSLIYEGTLDRFRDATIIVAHGGGYAPLYMGRLDRNVTNMPESARNITGLPSDYLGRLYYDACVYDPKTLVRLIETVGAERVLMGSDFPVGDPSPFHLLDQLPGLPPDSREAIVGKTAARLLRLNAV
jgi:aminocarboxymuconate-semialdehyde decarboxylase